MNTGADIAIDAQGLTKSFEGRVVVRDLSMRVKRGTIFGFLGPNGAGKTTTIRMMCGLLTPDSGHGTCLGLDIVRQVEVNDRDPQGCLLHGLGLVGEGLDLHRPVAELGVLVDHDARQRVVPHDELPAQVAKPDSLLTHDLTPYPNALAERHRQGKT